MIKELEKIGLTSGEARVYLALVKLGETSIGPLAKESKVAYSKIYNVLERLSEKGFASYIIKEKTKYFYPASPEQLNQFISEKEKELENTKKVAKELIKQLKPKENKEQEQTFIFTGLNGIFSAYELFLQKCKENEVIKYFYQDNKSERELVKKFYIDRPQFQELIKNYFEKKNIIWQGIFEKEGINPKNKYMQIKRIGKKIPANVDTSENCVIITTWSEKPQAIFIQSKEVARNFRNYFDKLWNEK